MRSTFLQKGLHGTSDGGLEQEFTRDTVVKFEGFVAFLVIFLDVLQKVRLCPVASKFRVMTIKVADTVGRVVIAVPTQILHDGLFTGAVSLFGHDGFVGVNGVLGVLRRGTAEKLVEEEQGFLRLTLLRQGIGQKGTDRAERSGGPKRRHDDAAVQFHAGGKCDAGGFVDCRLQTNELSFSSCGTSQTRNAESTYGMATKKSIVARGRRGSHTTRKER